MKNILQLHFGNGSFKSFLKDFHNNSKGSVVLIDHYFENSELIDTISINDNDYLHFIDSSVELSTDYIKISLMI